MNLQDLRDHLDKRFDKLEGKVDNHLERISKNETDVSWLKGHYKLTLSIIIAALGGLASAVLLNNPK